jgi:hypothetical protein
MITLSGAQGLMPRSFASSAISQASIPPLLWALAMRVDKRVLGASLAGVFALSGMRIGSGEDGRPGVSPARSLSTRPALVVTRLAFAAVIWQGGPQ